AVQGVVTFPSFFSPGGRDRGGARGGPRETRGGATLARRPRRVLRGAVPLLPARLLGKARQLVRRRIEAARRAGSREWIAGGEQVAEGGERIRWGGGRSHGVG